MNAHFHFHVCVIDGVFSEDAEGSVQFHEATHLMASDWDELQHTVRHRVLRYFHRQGLLERHVTDDMLTWKASGGFSIDASVHIPDRDRAGLERLLRRVPTGGGWPVLPSPSNGSRLPGTVHLVASASSIVSPIPHRMVPRLSRSLPSNSSSDSPCSFTRHASIVTAITGCWLPGYPPKVGPKLRYQVIALGREQGTAQESPSGQIDAQSGAGSSGGAPPGRRTSSRWASLIARIYDVLPLVCPWAPREAWSGGSMSIIAFVTDPVPVRSILSYLDLPTQPPPLSPARAPPQGIFEFDQTGGFDPKDPEPIPEFEFDQSLPD